MAKKDLDEKGQDYIDQDYRSMLDNNVSKKCWVAAGSDACEICKNNAKQGPIDVEEKFSSGHLKPLAHSGCECYIQAADNPFDFSDISIWDKAY